MVLEAYCKSDVYVLGLIIKELEAGNIEHIYKLWSLNSSVGRILLCQ